MSSFAGLANLGDISAGARPRRFCRLAIAAVSVAVASAAAPGPRHVASAADFRVAAGSGGLAQDAAGPTAEKTFRSDKLGFEFSYPGNREAVIGCHSSTNCVAVVGKPSRPGDYIIAFEIFDGPLDAVAATNAVFAKQE